MQNGIRRPYTYPNSISEGFSLARLVTRSSLAGVPAGRWVQRQESTPLAKIGGGAQNVSACGPGEADERKERASDLAKILGVDPSLGYRIVRGARQLTANQIRKIAEAYGLNPAALRP